MTRNCSNINIALGQICGMAMQLMTSLHRFRIRKLKVGVEGTYPPYTYHDDNDIYHFILYKAAIYRQTWWKQISQNLTGTSGIDSGRLDTVI